MSSDVVQDIIDKVFQRNHILFAEVLNLILRFHNSNIFYSLQGTGIENLAEYREKFIIGASFSSSSSLDISLSPNQPPVSVSNCFCYFDNFQFGISGSRLWECPADRLVQLCPTARETSRTTSHQQRASQVILILDWYVMSDSWLLNILRWKLLFCRHLEANKTTKHSISLATHPLPEVKSLDKIVMQTPTMEEPLLSLFAIFVHVFIWVSILL